MPLSATGVVKEFNGTFFRVETGGGITHLSPLFLLPWQVRSAKTGDRVRLAYRTPGSRGYWVVTEVVHAESENHVE